jgi:hypothetical protein
VIFFVLKINFNLNVIFEAQKVVIFSDQTKDISDENIELLNTA